MEKRKLKPNVLDIAIFAVIICSVAVIIFRDVIHSAVNKPEIVELTLTVEFYDTLSTDLENVETATVDFDVNSENNEIVTVNVEDAIYKTAVVKLNGYKKLGKFYSESGEVIKPGEQCSVTFEEKSQGGEIESVEING